MAASCSILKKKVIYHWIHYQKQTFNMHRYYQMFVPNHISDTDCKLLYRPPNYLWCGDRVYSLECGQRSFGNKRCIFKNSTFYSQVWQPWQAHVVFLNFSIQNTSISIIMIINIGNSSQKQERNNRRQVTAFFFI